MRTIPDSHLDLVSTGKAVTGEKFQDEVVMAIIDGTLSTVCFHLDIGLPIFFKLLQVVAQSGEGTISGTICINTPPPDVFDKTAL
ncbi:MAG: hypothetical protein ISN28_09315 [Ectothiorhodospiraceae bacterium AqS1]|nr:hypothetical protein [Ectothiorhodospiraceae bacterium AqS1]